jgi:hypothetical protein
MSPSALSAHEKKEFASELKFLVTPTVAEQIAAWARTHLVADPNAAGESHDTYEVTSLYFDTEDFGVIHRRNGLHRSKYRVRRYGGGAFFLERKLKVSGRLAKRRTPVAPTELALLADLAKPASPTNWAGHWFHQRVAGRRLRPVCQITYHRLARVLLTPTGPIRLTMDTGLRAQPVSGLTFQDSARAVPLLSGEVVLELKYRRELPALVRELAAQFALNTRPFSKYRAAAAILGLVPTTAADAAAATPAAIVPTLAHA